LRLTRSDPIMKLLLILCALLAFAQADFFEDLRSAQRKIKNVTPSSFDGVAGIPDATKKHLICFFNEIQKDENFDRFNVSTTL
jgi:hypothetical protein